MKLSEAIQLKVGQVLYFTPENKECCEVMSATYPLSRDYLLPGRPYVISFIRGLSKDDKEIFSRWEPRRPVPVPDKELIDIELELDISPFMFSAKDFSKEEPQHAKRTLRELVFDIENVNVQPSEYLASIITTNLYDTPIQDFKTFLEACQDMHQVMSFEKFQEVYRGDYEQEYHEMISMHGKNALPPLEDFIQENFKEGMKILLGKQKHYKNTLVVTSFLEKQGAQTYGAMLDLLEEGIVDKKIITTLFEEGYLVRKEIQLVAGIGYDNLLNDNLFNCYGDEE